ncbi:MAG: hypothetical protein QN144_14550 [Armatimonadota bacterium]|nr:hypothetical protein [Armatimonadota bacterium]
MDWQYADFNAPRPVTLAWFARQYLRPAEPRYTTRTQNRGLLHRKPTALVPDPRTGGPIATGRRQLLIERATEELLDDEDLEAAILLPTDHAPTKDLVRTLGAKEVARLAQVSCRHLKRWLVGKRNLSQLALTRVQHAINRLLDELSRFHTLLRSDPNPTTAARILGVSRWTLRRYIAGTHNPPHYRVLRYLQTRQTRRK